MGYGVAVGWAAIPCLTPASIVASTARSWANLASTVASMSGVGADWPPAQPMTAKARVKVRAIEADDRLNLGTRIYQSRMWESDDCT